MGSGEFRMLMLSRGHGTRRSTLTPALSQREREIDEPALGHKSIGLREPTGVAVDDPLAHEDSTAGGDLIFADGGVGQHTTTEGEGGWEEAERFFDDGLGVGELRNVAEFGPTVADDGGYFRDELAFDFGMLRQEIPSPDERVGSGFVAGEEKGHDFVAELTVGHAGLIDFVAGSDEFGQQIAVVAAFFAALADDAG